MNQLLSALYDSPEYQELRKAVQFNRCAALSGLAPITRAHYIAALCRDTGRPALILCHDDMAARSMQEMLQGFLGEEIPVLPSRDLTFYEASAVSRGWEQKRLSLLRELDAGRTPLVIASLQAITLRTIPAAICSRSDT